MKLSDLLIIDIETVPAEKTYDHLNQQWKALFTDKATKTVPFLENPAEIYQKRGGIWAEFGKIVCIGIGIFRWVDPVGWELDLFSFAGHEEVEILRNFAVFCEKQANNQPGFGFAGHNIREFDLPFIGRRMLINGVPLPISLQLQNKKPWELSHHFDTMAYWKFGDYKSYISLELLANVLGIDTPKQGISGADVQHLYYEQNNLPAIVAYCKKDVIATARIIQRYLNLPPVGDGQIKNG